MPDFEPGSSPEDQALLAEVADRLRRDRPVPRPAFRGDLRRQLLDRGLGGPARIESRWRVLVAVYSGLGVLLLAVASIGLVGAGPWAS